MKRFAGTLRSTHIGCRFVDPRTVVGRLAVLVLLAVMGGKAGLASDAQLGVARQASLPGSPVDPAWAKVASVHVSLVPQDMVEPRLLSASTPEVRVRAIADASKVAFLLEWDDATDDDVQMPAQFSDACAVQLPASIAADVPAPQMGEPGRTVEISYWRAAWQAVTDGRPDNVQSIHARSVVDHYPFEAEPLKKDAATGQEMAKRYAPARAVGNTMAGPREQPVEDLVAEGPGSLSPAPKAQSTGSGKRETEGWKVMIVRPLPIGLSAGKRTQVAFAVWDGGKREVGSRKMRSGWVPLTMGDDK